MQTPDPATIFFNAHHSPIGAFSSFTLGFPGAKGGFGIELPGPANEPVYLGLETAEGGSYQALPFFSAGIDESKRYDVAADAAVEKKKVRPFETGEITRDFQIATDTWRAGDLTFRLISPPKVVPDPKTAGKAEMMQAIVPAIFAEIIVDNRLGKRPRKMFFGYVGSDRHSNMRRLDETSHGHFAGVGQGLLTAIVSRSKGVYSGLGFDLEKILEPDLPENLTFGLGMTAALMAMVPAGKKVRYQFALCFYRGGIVTSGMECAYFYTRYFRSIEEVARYALEQWSEQSKLASRADRKIEKSRLNSAQRFMLCQAVRSYFGSTQFLEADGEPVWAVNEGEYRMLNTFDLTVDHLFFELAQNPWVVRNQLDLFVSRYSYTDQVRLPGNDTEYPGGLSFTHDMGVGNCWSRPGYSAYERYGLRGCFSQMTHEQLVNWVCCAVTYARQTKDRKWLKKNLGTFSNCLASLVNRDHPDPEQRDGVMSADSSRCMGGAEITTYDSLDVSLGQARRNLYLAVKTWAAYLGLRAVFGALGHSKSARLAEKQALLCAETIVAHLRDDGFIPAILGENNESRIIPAIEGLVFPQVWGLDQSLDETGEFGGLIEALKRHLDTVLVEGTCKFASGGWKLSSTNDNSWLSKIYLCQYVAREVLGFEKDEKADQIHAAWLLDERNAYFAWSDQMVAGKARGSRYYPRGVTAWLWLSE